MNNKHNQKFSAEHYAQINNYKHDSVKNFQATSVEFYVDKFYKSYKKENNDHMIIMMVIMISRYTYDLWSHVRNTITNVSYFMHLHKQ